MHLQWTYNASAMGLASLLVALLGACGTPTSPAPPASQGSEICQLVAPHTFAPMTMGFFQVNAVVPEVRADLDWIADTLKTRRCLCGEDRDGCAPEAP